MNKLLALLISTLALVAVGCGSDDEEEPAGGGSAQEQPAGSGGTKTTKVSMKDIEFKPDAITVDKGATVTWTNDESVPHDVTKEAGPGPDFSSGTGNLKQGDTYKQTFKTAGTIEYVCKVHPGMEGTVEVK